jgi:single-stranded-DNA-specific exonuclease
LLGYGGHFYAAGMTMSTENVDAFCKKFEEVVSNSIHPDLLIPEIAIDAEINFKDISSSYYNIFCQMEPYGPDNLRPVFLTRKVIDIGFSKVVKEKHIRFVLKQNGVTLSGIGFDMADKMSMLTTGQPVDIVYKIEENEWNGQKNLQLKVIDIKPS